MWQTGFIALAIVLIVWINRHYDAKESFVRMNEEEVTRLREMLSDANVVSQRAMENYEVSRKFLVLVEKMENEK